MTWMEASTCHSEPSEGGRHLHLRRTAGAVQVGIPEARLQRPRRAWGVQGIFLPTEARFASTCLTRLGNPPRIFTQIAQPGERPGRAGHRRGKSRTPCRPGAKLSGSKDPGWPALWKVVRHRRGKSRPGSPGRDESLRSWTEGRTLLWRAPPRPLWDRGAGVAFPEGL